MIEEMKKTISIIVGEGRGILAADESTGTATKRLEGIGVESTEENRRKYRQLLFTAPGVEKYFSGVILFEETLKQKDDSGIPFPKLLSDKNIVPGIKVDKGLIPLVNGKDEKVTQGLDGLPDRIKEYKELGAKFAKWRAVYSISDDKPSCLAMKTNAENLARYAAICQSQGIVPIVEPEVLIDGDHSIEQCEEVTERVQRHVFEALRRHKVILECMILKPSMVISGKSASNRADRKEVADATLRVLKRGVPGAVPTINFLSGGQSPVEATEHLQEMNASGNLPWNLSFSYGRALQEPALKAWAGKDENVQAAQEALLKRAKANYLATLGTYTKDMEA